VLLHNVRSVNVVEHLDRTAMHRSMPLPLLLGVG
jgi:hypothetical protein